MSVNPEGNTITNGYSASFDSIKVLQGTFVKKSFVTDGSLDQRFILDNPFIDTSTIVVYVKDDPNTVSSDPAQRFGADKGTLFTRVDNILKIDSTSSTFLIQEVQDEKYELLFGDGIFGRKIENGKTISVSYIITDGKDGNGPSSFTFAGTITDTLNNTINLSSQPSLSLIHI